MFSDVNRNNEQFKPWGKFRRISPAVMELRSLRMESHLIKWSTKYKNMRVRSFMGEVCKPLTSLVRRNLEQLPQTFRREIVFGAHQRWNAF